MKHPTTPMTSTTDKTGRATANERFTITMTRQIPSSEVWFAGGERIGYDPNGRAIVQTPGAPLSVFLRLEGDLAHAVSFLPGFPDGSFGWAKVLPYLPNAADLPRLFFDCVGMGDSDKPKDYSYSTAERTDFGKGPSSPLSHSCRGESSTRSPEAFLNCSQKGSVLYRLGFDGILNETLPM